MTTHNIVLLRQWTARMQWNLKYVKRQVVLLCLICLVTIVFTYISHIHEALTSSYLRTFIKENNTPSSRLNFRTEPRKVLCEFPEQDPFHPSIMQHFKKFPTLNCSRGLISLVYLDGDVLRVNRTKAKLHEITIEHCRVRFLQRHPNNDFEFADIELPGMFTNSIQIPLHFDYFVTKCFFHGRPVSSNYFNLIRKKKRTEDRCDNNYKRFIHENNPKETLSVLLIGVDGLSRQNMIRSMKKTKRFLTHNLEAIELFRFNKVGDNTFPNIVPMLSGLSKSEIFNRWPSKSYIDEVDRFFIWNDFQKAGYRTAMILDRAKITAFHYLKLGWSNPIFDYYNRPAVLASGNDDMSRSHHKRCIGQTPEVTFLLDNWVQLTSLFNNTRSKPYFGFSFFNRMTHERSDLAMANDQHYMEFLQTLQSRDVLNNTLLVFFSDHGPRFGPARSTKNGMMESRTPFLFLVIPDWFKRKYRDLISALHTNQHRLTTMFDVHATLKHLLNFQGTTQKGDLDSRGISLFHEIPANRMCHHAHVPVQYCMCTNLATNENITPQMINDIAKVLLQHIVNITREFRKLCVELVLKSISTVASFVKDAKIDDEIIYQMVIETGPNGALFEGTLEYNKITRNTQVVGHPIRLNLYKRQADCVNSANLRLYCLCKNAVTP